MADLREWLAEQGMSYRAFARAAGVPFDSIGRIIRGVQKPSRRYVERIAEATGGEVQLEPRSGSAAGRPRKPPGNSTARLIDRLGGPAKVARAADTAESTVYRWIAANRIPTSAIGAIAAYAQEIGVPLGEDEPEASKGASNGGHVRQ